MHLPRFGAGRSAWGLSLGVEVMSLITCERHAPAEAPSWQIKELWEEGRRLCGIEEDEQEVDRVFPETL